MSYITKNKNLIGIYCMVTWLQSLLWLNKLARSCPLALMEQ